MWTKAWPSLEITGLEGAVREVERLVRHPLTGQPNEVTGALARFLVVRSCGYLEQAVKECCLAYITSKSDPRVLPHAASVFRRSINPRPEQLLTIVRAFDSSWESELADFLDNDDQRLKRAISFLVDRRNKISHGLGENVTSRKALDLLEAADDVVTWFVLRFDPR